MLGDQIGHIPEEPTDDDEDDDELTRHALSMQ
jgi:hypothetical protein